MVEALQLGWIRGAGLDVFESEPLNPAHPLLGMDNVLCPPHMAGVTRGTARKRGLACVENANRPAQGLPPLYRVA